MLLNVVINDRIGDWWYFTQFNMVAMLNFDQSLLGKSHTRCWSSQDVIGW